MLMTVCTTGWVRRAAVALGAACAVVAATGPRAPAAGAVTRDRVTSVVTTWRPTAVRLGDRGDGGGRVRYRLSGPGPRHGTLAGVPPSMVYTPARGYVGPDSFRYRAGVPGGPRWSGIVLITVKRPNVVVVMSDDQTAEQQRFLPATTSFVGDGGTTFSDAVVSYAECCPSRATFLTGRYAHNHGVLSSAPPTGGVTRFDDRATLATRLRAAGYHTSLTGKYLNGYGDQVPAGYVPPGWTDWLALVEPDAYNYLDYDVSDNGTVVHHGRDAADYATDVVFERADRRIRADAGSATPFFVVVTPTAPHNATGWVAAVPAARHEGLAVGQRAPRTPAFNQADVSTMPSWISRLPLLGEQQIAGIDNVYRLAGESLLAVDEGVDRLRRTLVETGELDNTVFVYTSDNGYAYGEHRVVLGKSNEYEESVRVPLLIRGPGFPAGTAVDRPVANVDLAPTIAAVAGVRLAGPVDGVPLTRFVGDPAYGAGRAVLIENGPLWGRRTYVGVRDGRWKYVVSSGGERELFDLQLDPHETENLIGVPRAALAELAGGARTAQLAACSGETCRLGVP